MKRQSIANTDERLLPSVTVVIPAYNVEHTVGQCIESVLAQTYPSERYQVVVVDNNSVDRTAEIAKRYPVRLVHERRIQTSYAARNRGIEEVNSELVAFLDSDCFAEPDWLVQLIKPFEDSTVGAVGGQRKSQKPKSDASIIENFLAVFWVHDERLYQNRGPKGFPTSNVAYKMDALKEVGIFESSMQGAADVDLAWRVQLYGKWKGVYQPKAIVSHKHHTELSDCLRQFHRDGYYEIILTTLYRNIVWPQGSPSFQMRLIGRQLGAVMLYILSFGIRFVRFGRWRKDRTYLLWPLLLLLVESSNITGKLQGLLSTRLFRRTPFQISRRLRLTALERGSLA